MSDSPFATMIAQLEKWHAELQKSDVRPYGNKTWMVYHPALRSWLLQFVPPPTDLPYYGMGLNRLLGIPTWETETVYSDNGQRVHLKHDEILMVHEDAMSALIGKAWDEGPGRVLARMKKEMEDYQAMLDVYWKEHEGNESV
jgi:hypothetical protein